MSIDHPMPYGSAGQEPVEPVGFDPGTWLSPPPVRPKFQNRWGRHIVLFLLTLGTTTAVEMSAPGPGAGFGWRNVLDGLRYSLPLLAILGAHEFGHYLLCRRHDVDATLPYFIPAPPMLVLTGTFGAVIRIREAFPSKKALFDIGVAGPIAGFVVLLPFLYWGVGLSQVVPTPHSGPVIYFGEPLLFKLVEWLQFGTLPDGYDIVLHPMGFAAWVGMLVTALNLMPFGQLDGGHIAYSVFGRRARMVSILTLSIVVLLTLQSISWAGVTLMMLVMALFLGVRHPRVIDEGVPLDPRRTAVALFALIMFVLCFTPVPIHLLLNQ